jgi:hypothetical protein
MQAHWVLGLALSWPAFGAARLEWNAPLSDCQPVDLAVSSTGQSYVTCQEPYGQAVLLMSYELNGRLAVSKVLPAAQQESWLPHDLLLHEGILYLSLTIRRTNGTHAQLLALQPETLELLWQKEEAHFVGNNLVALPQAGLWWLGVNDARDADILAFRYDAEGKLQASFRYDSGDHDHLGFDRRSGAAGPEHGLYIGAFSQILRVAADGTLLWKNDFPSTAITSRTDGSLIVTHMRAPQGGTALFTEDGRKLWDIDEGGMALALAPDQSLWVTGTRMTDQSIGWDLRILNIDRSGRLLAQDVYAGPFQDRAVDIATDAQGNAYVLASSYVKEGWMAARERYLILKYNAQAQRLWSHLYGTVGLPEALHVTPQGDVYALGRDGTILLRD